MYLKQCPFCGGEPEMYWRKGRIGLFVYCKCTVCDAQTGTKTAHGNPEDDDFWEQNAVKAVEQKWNSRIEGK